MLFFLFQLYLEERSQCRARCHCELKKKKTTLIEKSFFGQKNQEKSPYWTDSLKAGSLKEKIFQKETP